MEQLKQVVVFSQVDEGRGIGAAKGRVAAVNNVLEVGGGNLFGRNVQREHLVGQVGKAQVLPGLP